MANWIPFVEGEYAVEQALIVAPDNRAVAVGNTVIATIIDARIEADTAIAMSEYNWPASCSINATGRNTSTTPKSTTAMSTSAAERRMTVAERELDEDRWAFVRLPSRLGWDSHNSLRMALDSRHQLHLCGNMHVDPLIYFRSTRPLDVTENAGGCELSSTVSVVE